MSSVLRNLLIRVGVDLSDANSGLKKLSGKLRRAGRQMENTGRTLTKGLTVPLVAVGVAAVKVGIDFENSLAKVNTIADTSVKSLQEFEKEVLAISNATGTAGTEINEALYQAISAGADTAKVMGLVETSVKSAKGGFTDVTTAVDGLTSVLNSYGMATEDADHLANLFFATQKKGKTTFGELAQSIGNVAPIASVAGVAVEDLLAGIASLTANGLETTIAITGIRTALTNVIKPSADAAKVAKELGIDFSTAALKSKGFVGFLQDIQEKTGGNVDTMAKLFGNVRGLNAILSLTSDTGMAKMLETLDEMENSTDAVDEAFNIMNDTVGNQLKKALNVLKNVGIELSRNLMPIMTNKIIPAIKRFAEGIANLLDKFNNMSSVQQRFVTFGLKFLIVLGPVLILIGKLSKGIAFLMKNMVAMGKAVGALSKIFALLGPVAAVTIALVALAAIIGTIVILYSEATKEAREFRKETKELIKSSDDLRKNYVKQQESMFVNRQLAAQLRDELFDLNKTENKSAEDKARMVTLVNQLNGMYDGLNISIDETTGLLDQEEKSIRDVIKAKNKQIEQLAREARLLELAKEKIVLEEQLALAAERAADRYKVQADAMDELVEKYARVMKGSGKLQFVEIKNYVELRKALAENEIAYDKSMDSFGEMAESISEDSGEITKTIIDNSDAILEKETEVADKRIEYQEKVEEATRRHFDEMGGLFDGADKTTTQSAEKTIENMQSQIDAINEWESNLATLAAKVDEDGKKIFSDGIIQEMRDGGIEQANILAGMVIASDDELLKIEELYQERWGNAKDNAVAELGELKDEIDVLTTETATLLADNTAIGKHAGILGESLVNGFTLGMKRKLSALRRVATSVGNTALGGIRGALQSRSPSKKAIAIGETVPEGLAIGILGKARLAINAATSTASGVMGGLQMSTLSPAMAGGSSMNMMGGAGVHLTVNVNGLLVAQNDLGEVVGEAVVSKLQSLGVGN